MAPSTTYNIPSFESWPLTVQTLMSISDDINTDCHGDEEDSIRVSFQTNNYTLNRLEIFRTFRHWPKLPGNGLTKLECITCWRSNNKDNCDHIFEDIGSYWCAKRLRRHPELSKRKYTLPGFPIVVTISNSFEFNTHGVR